MNRDGPNQDCFVCAIMAKGQGDRDKVVRSARDDVEGRRIIVQDFCDQFVTPKCPALKGKPKIFVVNVSRKF